MAPVCYHEVVAPQFAGVAVTWAKPIHFHIVSAGPILFFHLVLVTRKSNIIFWMLIRLRFMF